MTALPRLAEWLTSEGGWFVRDLLSRPGLIELDWCYANHRGFGGAHYALVLSEPPHDFLPPEIRERREPGWSDDEVDPDAVAEALAAAAASEEPAEQHASDRWWIRRDADKVVLYIELE